MALNREAGRARGEGGALIQDHGVSGGRGGDDPGVVSGDFGSDRSVVTRPRNRLTE